MLAVHRISKTACAAGMISGLAILALAAAMSPGHAQRADEIWVLEIKQGTASLEFGGRSDPGSKQLGYLNQSFSCKSGGSGTMYINEGMPIAWATKPNVPIAGKRNVTIETATGSFSLQADVLNNEEAGTPGLNVTLSRSQMRSVLESPGQIHIRSGTFRTRIGLRGVEPHREAFLKVCG
jgi:hypothetical protein